MKNVHLLHVLYSHIDVPPWTLMCVNEPYPGLDFSF